MEKSALVIKNIVRVCMHGALLLAVAACSFVVQAEAAQKLQKVEVRQAAVARALASDKKQQKAAKGAKPSVQSSAQKDRKVLAKTVEPKLSPASVKKNKVITDAPKSSTVKVGLKTNGSKASKASKSKMGVVLASSQQKPGAVVKTSYKKAKSSDKQKAQKSPRKQPIVQMAAVERRGQFGPLRGQGTPLQQVALPVVPEPVKVSPAMPQIISVRASAAEQAAVPVSHDVKASGLLRTAYHFLKTTYRSGGSAPSGFDCSGFVHYIFNMHGINLPRSSSEQAQKGVSVQMTQLRPGDLVFFSTIRRGISHVGIFIKNGLFIHSASNGKGVSLDSLGSDYWSSRFRLARRVDLSGAKQVALADLRKSSAG